MNANQVHVIQDIAEPPQPELGESHTKHSGRSEPPASHHAVAIPLARACLPAISQFQLPSNTFRCKRFIQFARSRTRNKEYLDALKTVERLLALMEVALRNFHKSLGSGDVDDGQPEPDCTLEASRELSLELTDRFRETTFNVVKVWDDSDASSTSSDSWPFTTPADTYTSSDSEPSTPYIGPMNGDWKWIADLIMLLWETLEGGKCDSIINPSRNSWSRFMEARYSDWLAGGDLSLALGEVSEHRSTDLADVSSDIQIIATSSIRSSATQPSILLDT
ncbi:hypothetical protein AAF712_015654 [Marasmius tenuissimus]|uniref:Uncharacterized protein n=1 Tax=Marasmius tenuissimus TaxID=585030 RepID=A0ABR2Z9V4_9AGAR